MDDNGIFAWAIRMQEYANRPREQQIGESKCDMDLCNECPNIENCRYFYKHDVVLGHHPHCRCPDGFMEKVLVTEIPGVHWKQSGKSKHGTGLTDAERNEIRATKVKKDKICLYCLVEVLNGVRKKVTRTMTRGKYWLCRRHVGRFVAWRQENRDRVEEGRGNVHIVYERKH